MSARVMPDMTGVTLPPTLPAAVRAEFARAFRPPFETPAVVLFNGLLLSGCWFLLPAALRDWLFTANGPLAFPVILAMWMYADVPATNVLAPDRYRVAAALHDPVTLRRLLYAKNIVLWVLVAPLCTLLAVAVGFGSGHIRRTLMSVIVIAVVPFGALGVSAWVGIRFPYHPVPLRFRWAHRRPWRHTILRWLALAVVPYGLVPFLCLLLVAPSLVARAVVARSRLSGRILGGNFTLGVAVACVLAAAMWLLGHHIGVRLALRRRAALSAYLADPELG